MTTVLPFLISSWQLQRTCCDGLGGAATSRKRLCNHPFLNYPLPRCGDPKHTKDTIIYLH